MKINFSVFPGGKTKALTMSYDDGVMQDMRLADIFNRNGIKATFHINGGMIGDKGARTRIAQEDILSVYQGHEISAHGFTHQSLSVTPNERIAEEILRDRAALEGITGNLIRGMSYPNGSVNPTVVEMLRLLGIEYCRMVETTGQFYLPEDFLYWKGTCHHNQNLLKKGEEFLETRPKWQPLLMYVWGHSYEFDNDNNWEIMEEFCKRLGGRDDIWYATNIEIVDYIKAVRGLKFSATQNMVLNQSMIDCYIAVNDAVVLIPAGSTVRL